MTNAVDIAMNVARRRKRAAGGHVGPLKGDTGGREDAVPLDVPAGCHVIPADVVSGMGEGNTENGMKVLERMFPHDGGAADGQPVPIQAAHGEFIVSPDEVLKIGAGDQERGHKEIDRFIVMMRKKIIRTMNKLPGPSKD